MMLKYLTVKYPVNIHNWPDPEEKWAIVNNFGIDGVGTVDVNGTLRTVCGFVFGVVAAEIISEVIGEAWVGQVDNVEGVDTKWSNAPWDDKGRHQRIGDIGWERL